MQSTSKRFIIMADVDSTFEEYTPGTNEFAVFEKVLLQLENTVGVPVVIHFVSGNTAGDMVERLKLLKAKYPEIYNRLDYMVLEHGKKYSTELKQIGVCATDHAAYTKADGVFDIIESHTKRNIVGLCFLGDGMNDVPAFQMVNYYKNTFPLGNYCLAPRSRRYYDQIKTFLNAYSEKPRILGCSECIMKILPEIKRKTQSKDTL